jgi:hypothetical protein
MADIKVLYINADGYQQEHSEASDSIKMASLKTANNELTDGLLGALVGGSDGTSAHSHDSIYFRETEFISSTAGAADAGKPVKTGASGYVNDLVDVAAITSSIDHGGLIGLGDDDHTIYTKADGTRAFTGKVSYSVHPSFADDKELVDKKYVDDKVDALAMGIEWQDSVISRSANPPGSPVSGDRYLVIATATGAWVGQEDKIAEYNGSSWIFTTATTGMAVAVDNEPTVLYFWSGTAWEAKSFEATTASTGLVKVGNDIRIDSGAAGAGLSFLAGVLSVNPAAAGGLEVVSDAVQIKADGVKDTMIDFGTGAGQVSAVDIPIADVGGFTSQVDVEGAIQELYGQISQQGVEYVAGVGGTTAGHPVYVSSNDTALKYTSLTNAARIVGVASTTEVATSPVKVLANDTVVTGVLSGATAGDIIYWNGSALSSTIPSGGGSHVWKIGVAKNTTDLHVEIEFIKKNA